MPPGPPRGPSAEQPADRRSWLVWLSAAAVYLLAVFHRASFGVAGLQAADRFEVGAAALGVFTVLQVGVYAAMQIPTGVLVDRFGPRAVLTGAVLLLGAGQLLLAAAHSYPLGLLARAVVGCGDALTFVSVLRLAANHFPRRQYMLVMSLTTALGYVGNLVATLPLTLLLAGPGWGATFGVVGAATLGYAAVARLRVADRPAGAPPEPPGDTSPRQVAAQVARAWRVPGTRLGFWTHFSTMFAPNVLTLLWGVPFLVQGQGYTAPEASSLLIVFVVGSMLGGPAVGALIGRRPGTRMPMVLGYLAAAAVVWAVLLGWPGTIPLGVLVPAFAVLSIGGPVSSIGFALARDYNPLPRVGTATGVVNVGGFVATTITALGIGVLLQATGGQFRIALGLIAVVLAGGSWRMLTWYRRARAATLAAQSRGEDVPVEIRRRAFDGAAPAYSVAVAE